MDKRRREPLYSYQETNHSGRGIAATVLGAVSLLLFVVLTGISAMRGGSGGPWVGSFGAAAFLIAFYGMVMGLRSFRDRCRSYNMSKAGTIISGIVTAVWFLVFCAGIM